MRPHLPRRAAGRQKPYLGTRGTTFLATVVLLWGAVSLGVAVVEPVNQLTQPGGDVSVMLTGDELVLARVPGLPDGTWLEPDPDQVGLLLQVQSLPAGLRLATEAGTVVRGLSSALAAWLVWRLLSVIGAGRPFEARNPARLAAVALLVIVAGSGAQVVEHVVTMAVLEHLDATRAGTPFDIGVTFDLTPALLAAVLLALAEAFRRGRQLAEDVEGLI